MPNIEAMKAEFYRQTSYLPTVVPFSGHMHFVYDEVKKRPGAVCVELGVFNVGPHSTTAFLWAAVEVGATVYSCDITPCEYTVKYVREVYEIPVNKQTWFFTQMDSVDYGRKWRYNKMPEIDVLLVDTSHARDQTRKELTMWIPMLSPNGIAMFHDTVSGPHGVRAPIEEYIAAHSDEYTWHNRENSHGLGIIRRVGSE